MIDFVEIYRADESGRLALDAVIDDFSSVIWEQAYFGVGEFEIYAPATPASLSALKGGRFVRTPGGGDEEIGIIERVEVTTDPEEGAMIAASGRMAKGILDRRIIYSPVFDPGEGGNGYIWRCNARTLSGRVDACAAGLVRDNAAAAGNPDPVHLRGDRTLPVMAWVAGADDLSRFPETISVATEEGEEDAEKQVTYKNLLDYTDGLLEEYGLGAYLWLDRDRMKLRYRVRKGASRSREDHPDGEPVIFSQAMDNLTSTAYAYDEAAKKTTALIGGEGEGTDRKLAFAFEWISGMERREVFVDASSITSEAEEGAPAVTMSDYRKQLETQGQQTIRQSPAEETLSGEMDITNAAVSYREDFGVGDIVTLEDSRLGLSKAVRILSVTEVQDSNGYQVKIEYGDK